MTNIGKNTYDFVRGYSYGVAGLVIGIPTATRLWANGKYKSQSIGPATTGMIAGIGTIMYVLPSRPVNHLDMLPDYQLSESTDLEIVFAGSQIISSVYELGRWAKRKLKNQTNKPHDLEERISTAVKRELKETQRLFTEEQR